MLVTGVCFDTDRHKKNIGKYNMAMTFRVSGHSAKVQLFSCILSLQPSKTIF